MSDRDSYTDSSFAHLHNMASLVSVQRGPSAHLPAKQKEATPKDSEKDPLPASLFRKIAEFPKYEINPYGATRKIGKTTPLKLVRAKNQLQLNFCRTTVSVQRLVAETFCDRPPNSYLHCKCKDVPQSLASLDYRNLIWTVDRLCKKCDTKVAGSRNEIGQCKECDKKVSVNRRKRYAKQSDGKREEAQKTAFPDGVKLCKDCGLLLPLSKFHRNNDYTHGLDTYCKEHAAERQKNGNDKNNSRTAEEIETKQKEVHPNGTKRCFNCRKDLELSEYNVRKDNKDGLEPRCKSCEPFYLCALIRKWLRVELNCHKCGEVRWNSKHMNHFQGYKIKDPRLFVVVEELLQELPKLEILCAFCHALYTQGKRQEQLLDRPKTVNRRNAWNRTDGAHAITNELKLRAECIDCKRPYEVEHRHGFHFDHLPGETKISCVGEMVKKSYKVEEIVAEMKKCELRCASCHFVKTYERERDNKKRQYDTPLTIRQEFAKRFDDTEQRLIIEASATMIERANCNGNPVFLGINTQAIAAFHKQQQMSVEVDV